MDRSRTAADIERLRPSAEPIRRGMSSSRDAVTAVRELAEQLGRSDNAAVIFSCSATYELDRLEAELNERFDGAQLIGCTTAGEIALDGYAQETLVGVSFPRSDFITAIEHCDRIDSASLVEVCATVQTLVRRLALRAPAANDKNTLTNLLGNYAPTADQNDAYLIGPPGYEGGNATYADCYGQILAGTAPCAPGLPAGTTPYTLGNGVPTNDGVNRAVPWNYGTGGYIAQSYPQSRSVQVRLRYRL